MSFIQAYLEEDQRYRNLREEKVSEKHAEIIAKKVSRHYKLGVKSVKFFGNVDSGHAWKFYDMIKISHNPSLLVVAHELNHFLIWKKYPNRHVNHGSKKWQRCLQRIIDYCEKKNWWKEELGHRAEKQVKTFEKRLEREAYKKTPNYMLEQIQKAMKNWESKRRRAENAIKRLSRRQKIWEKKVKFFE